MPVRRILYVSRWFPFPPDNGARLRAWGLLRALAERHEVTLLSFLEEDQLATTAEAATVCRRVVAVPRLPYRPNGWRARAGYLSSQPRSLVDMFSTAMRDSLQKEVRDGGYDAVVAAAFDMSGYAPWLGSLPAILDDMEVGGFEQKLYAASMGDRLRARLTWFKLRHYLAGMLPRFALCTVASPQEREALARAVPAYEGVRVLENSIDTRACAEVREERRPHRLVFAGSLAYGPNRDAMTWFCDRILPRIRAVAPAVELDISGALPGASFHAPPGVRLVGHLPDVRPLIAAATVSVTPIRLGGGTRLKILEAMALGTPVVSTSKSAEGLDVLHGEHLLLAEDEETFAAQVLRLLGDAALRRRLAEAARALVERRYDTAVVGRRFLELVEVVIESGRRGE